MFKGNKSEVFAAENAALKREIELLRERIDELKADNLDFKERLKYTQEALIAKESPEVYFDKRYHQELAKAAEHAAEKLATPEGDLLADKERREFAQRASIVSRLAEQMERPLFIDADDMIQQLNRVTGLPVVTNPSLHGNDES